MEQRRVKKIDVLKCVGTGETTSWLRVFADLSEDLDLSPSTYVG